MEKIICEGLCACPKCGSENRALVTNARHAFQVRCYDCGMKTQWAKKTDALCEWFNSFINK